MAWRREGPRDKASPGLEKGRQGVDNIMGGREGLEEEKGGGRKGEKGRLGDGPAEEEHGARAEGLSWGSGREQESAWEEERDSILEKQPASQREGEAGRRGGSPGGEQRPGQGTEAERPHDWESPTRHRERAGDSGAGRTRPRGRKWGEEAEKGQEQMRAAGAPHGAQDTENGNGGGGVKE